MTFTSLVAPGQPTDGGAGVPRAQEGPHRVERAGYGEDDGHFGLGGRARQVPVEQSAADAAGAVVPGRLRVLQRVRPQLHVGGRGEGRRGLFPAGWHRQEQVVQVAGLEEEGAQAAHAGRQAASHNHDGLVKRRSRCYRVFAQYENIILSLTSTIVSDCALHLPSSLMTSTDRLLTLSHVKKLSQPFK